MHRHGDDRPRGEKVSKAPQAINKEEGVEGSLPENGV